VRNVLIAIGNSGDRALAAEAERLVDDASPLVRGAAIWALARLEPQRLAGLAEKRPHETDESVQEEWSVALAVIPGRRAAASPESITTTGARS
jgi:epoxyqueuosine reductase